MGFIVWILLGLVVGVIAKFLMPGKDPGGHYHNNTAGDRRRIRGGICQFLTGFRQRHRF